MPSTATDRIDGVSTSTAIKAPCRFATTANISLAGLAVQGGGEWISPLTAEDRIFVWHQTNSLDNGIWVAAGGTWARAKDFDGARDAVQGTLISVYRTAGLSPLYRLTTANPVRFGISTITFEEIDIDADVIRDELEDTDDPANGDALIGVKRVLTGSVATTLHAFIEADPYFDVVRDFGADSTGVIDSTAAIQAAITAAQSLAGSTLQPGGGIVFIPAGNYKITSTLFVTSGCSIRGSGMFTSLLKPGAGVSCIKISNTQAPTQMEYFGILYDVNATSVAVIGIEEVIPSNTGIQPHARYNNLFIQNFGTGISIKNGSYWTMHDVFMYSPVASGIALEVDNLTNYDQGDIAVTGCTFNALGYGVKWTGADGFRFVNNKIIGPTYGLFFQMATGNNGSDIIISNNSIEGIGANCIVFTRAGTTGAMNCVQIIGNQMGLTATGTAIQVPTDATGWWIVNMIISNNIIVGPQGAANVGIGINDIQNLIVEGNVMNSNYSGAGGTQFIFVGSDVTNGLVANNSGLGTFVPSANGSATTKMINTPGWVDSNKGTGVISAAATSVVITHGLSLTPVASNIKITPTVLSTDDPGEIYIDTITSTQFTVHCRNVPGASTLTFGWSAQL